jgi:hypothetical protein
MLNKIFIENLFKSKLSMIKEIWAFSRYRWKTLNEYRILRRRFVIFFEPKVQQILNF